MGQNKVQAISGSDLLRRKSPRTRARRTPHPSARAARLRLTGIIYAVCSLTGLQLAVREFEADGGRKALILKPPAAPKAP